VKEGAKMAGVVRTGPRQIVVDFMQPLKQPLKQPLSVRVSRFNYLVDRGCECDLAQAGKVGVAGLRGKLLGSSRLRY